MIRTTRIIATVPYVFTQLDDPALGSGWKVTCNGSKTYHFGRSYFVRCAPNGRPYSCTCPTCPHRSPDPEREGWLACKHVRAVEEIWREQQPTEATT